MKKICFVGLYDEKNMGDPIIAECTEQLFRKNIPSLKCSHATLDFCMNHMPMALHRRIARKIYKFSKPRNRIDYGVYYEARRYFAGTLRDADAAVVVGGGLVKYKYQHFHEQLSALIKAAEDIGTDVYFNAVGVEGYDERDERCLLLKEHLNKQCVRRITVRDDIETLRNKYISPFSNITSKYVADPAVWSAEIYGIESDKESRKIGIGIARGKLFEDNDEKLSENEITSIYVETVKVLISRGEQVTLFTNGLGKDNEELFIVRNVLKKDGVDVDYLIPDSARQLIEIISGFRAIIATRLHSCIVAYSLGIPAVGMVWNDKLKLWGKNIGQQDSFVERRNLNSVILTERLYDAIKGGYDMSLRETFRNSIVEDIREVSQII